MASVILRNVQKRYREQIAVRDFNLEIGDTEFVVVVGPSGCGKTTTLRMIAGLEEVTAGEIFIDGRLVNDVAPKDRNIAMVFQNYALYPNMTVFENMAFGLKLRKKPKPAIEQAVRDIAQMLNIERYLDRKPAKLSGGERQRVAIGRALVREPQVFLMDEPLSNLDAKLRNTMRAEILRLHKKLNATFIYVTHDQVEAMTLGDRIVVMRDGLIQQVGSPDEIYRAPANKYVGDFIGSPSMNFLPAVIVEGPGGVRARLHEAGGSLCLPERMEKPRGVREVVGREVTVGIRPEHVAIGAIAGEPNRLEAICEVVERMGSETLLHLRLGSLELLARVGGEQEIEEDARVTVAIPVERLFVFDAATEENILGSVGDVA